MQTIFYELINFKMYFDVGFGSSHQRGLKNLVKVNIAIGGAKLLSTYNEVTKLCKKSKSLLLTLGSNDIQLRRGWPDPHQEIEILRHFQKLLILRSQWQPKKRFLVILPLPRYYSSSRRVAKEKYLHILSILERLMRDTLLIIGEQARYIRVLNFQGLMKDPENFQKDFVHLSAKGLNIVTKKIEKTIDCMEL